ncbi:MAG TPA: ATP-binding protein [Vicinamibacterales bacterium]|nr:ATP-binding protein [Vicinamibacterales bacterium]
MRSWRTEAVHAAVSIGGIAAMTALYFSWLHVTDATTVALSYLLLILFVAAWSPLWVSLAASVVAALALNFFFLPPIFTLNINESQDWAAFFAFIVVSVVASRLSSLARGRARELGRLFEFSREALREPGDAALRVLAQQVADRFFLDYVAFFVPDGNGAHRTESGTLGPRRMPDADVLRAIAQGSFTAGDELEEVSGVFVSGALNESPLWLVPLRRGAEAVGVLAIGGRRLEPTTLKALASVVAIAIERVRLVEQRQQSEVARRSVEIKSALLTSLGHDLRTPLTAMSAAVSNLGMTEISDAQRRRQADVALTALDRLTRLFENILEMARLDADGATPSLRWAHLEEVIQAARSKVDLALRGRRIAVVDSTDEYVALLDPRLLATALAHLLENAAQYSPTSSTITVTVESVSGGLTVHVDDEGEGLGAEDVPHIFERFYRGAKAERHRSGTGMGLAIVSGLMQAMGGRVTAENRSSIGARFSLFVPARTRSIADENPAVADS